MYDIRIYRIQIIMIHLGGCVCASLHTAAYLRTHNGESVILFMIIEFNETIDGISAHLHNTKLAKC